MRAAFPIENNRESDHVDNLSPRNTAQICRAAQRSLELVVRKTESYDIEADQLKVIDEVNLRGFETPFNQEHDTNNKL